MADPAEQAAPIEDDEPEETPGYKAPAQKTLDEIQQLDADDESLVRYKQMLLGGATAGKKVQLTKAAWFTCAFKKLWVSSYNRPFFRPGGDDGGANVLVEKMSIVIDGRKDIDLDLTGLY